MLINIMFISIILFDQPVDKRANKTSFEIKGSSILGIILADFRLIFWG
jgi:hypothetical protein